MDGSRCIRYCDSLYGLYFLYAVYAVIHGNQLMCEVSVSRAIASSDHTCVEENLRNNYPNGSLHFSKR